MERNLIKKVEIIDSFISRLIIFVPFLIIFIPFDVILGRIIDKKELLMFLSIIFTIILYCAFLIGAAYIGKYIRDYICKEILVVKYRFYKIKNEYFSKDWDIKTEIVAEDIVTLNNKIEITTKYFLILTSHKKIEISQEQYLELSKVSSMEEKPLLKLSEEEFNNINENNVLNSFNIC